MADDKKIVVFKPISKINKAARELSKLGAAKGGEARALSLNAEERSKIARQAVQTRWEKAGVRHIPRAEYGSPDRPLRIGDLEIPCYVLEDGKRVLHHRGMVAALGMARGGSSKGGGDRLAHFTTQKTLQSFVSEQLLEVTTNPLKFRTPRGKLAYGYEATVLADICDAILAARKAGVLQKQQFHIAERAELLVRGFARVGIIALVDEATGYQDYRTKEALRHILEKFIAKELQPWVKTFEADYYKEIFRLNEWDFKASSVKRPGVIGHWTNDIVYNRLAPGIKEELHRLAERDEKGRPKHKLFQRLTEGTGHPKLREHLSAVTALMKAAGSWAGFKRLLDRALPRFETNRPLPFEDIENEDKE